MDITKGTDYPNPREKANPLSVLFFGYTIGLFKKGYSKQLDVEDIYNPLKNDRSKIVGNRLQRKWDKQLARAKDIEGKPSLLKAIASAFWPEYIYLGCLMGFLDIGIRLSQPAFLAGLLTYFNPSSTTTKKEALLYALGMLACNFTGMVLINQYVVGALHAGMKVRAATCALIYKKALKLSKTALGDTSSGKIVNLLSNDVSRFDMVSVTLNQMWVGPVVALIVMFLLYREAGLAGVVGVGVVFIVVPLQSYTGKLSARYRKQTAMRTDERVRLMDEIISGIQVIKMYAWEKPFEKVISWARKSEIKVVTKASYVRATFMAFMLFTTRCALFCTLLTMVLSDKPITAARTFMFMGYFNHLSMGMAGMFVRGISEIAELLVAIRRIEGFLLNEEYVPADKATHANGYKDQEKVVLSMRNYDAKWNKSIEDLVLKDININVPKGNLIGVIGPVGSGKSALLQGILGELVKVRGDLYVDGTVSFASQEPWVFSATLRQNILFGADYDKERYREVVRVCALERDFEQFPDGDHTIVGEKGASLSGGQKARINLARAVYRDADIYLLDDPLSAVDIHVSKVLYEECVNGLLAKKTRILVTHQVYYLKDNDRILILNNGAIEDEGTFHELAQSNNEYSKLLTEEIPEEEPPQELPKETQLVRRPSSVKRQISQISRRSRKESITSIVSEISIAKSILEEVADEDEDTDDEEQKVDLKVMQEESSKGKVKGNLLLHYFGAGGNIFVVTMVIALYACAQGSASGVDYWVNYFVNIEEYKHSQNSTLDPNNLPFAYNWTTSACLTLYGVGILTLFCIAMTRSVLFYTVAMRASKKLHNIVFANVIGATMRFFDTNPSGRVLNRFTKDMGAIDEMLPRVLIDATQTLLQVSGSVFLITIVNPYFLILLGGLCVVFWFMRKVYLRSSKNIKRLEGMMRSPVFTHLNATIQGLTTIRAFGQQDVLQEEFDKHQDYHSSSWYMFISTSQAFSLFMNMFCFCFTVTVTLVFILFGEYFGLKAGEVGLAITQSTSLAGMLQMGMKSSADVSNQLLSVERVLEYKSLPKEPKPATKTPPPATWPKKGEVLFKNMCLRYFESGPMVLRHLNFIVKPKEKVGVVGRTGAGKSSLIQALFRLAPIEGSVLIDDVDTKDVDLETLRLRISIIPQDPVLFSGTLRYNLDPFEEYNDDVLYRALDEVELKDPANIINRLENRVMDRGSNYSVGQRQLICLARAIIRNNKILMLDEATANVDPQTDTLIQRTIRRKFVDCTVITVAHRLNTVIDSDKILVMDSGRVVEYDHPYVLLQNTNGIFYHMVEETGPAVSDLLKNQAKESYDKGIKAM